MVHVKVWSGGCNARIIDMTNAGKVGKRCERLYVQGVPWTPSDRETPEQVQARKASESLLAYLLCLHDDVRDGGALLPVEYGDLAAEVFTRVWTAQQAGVSESSLSVHPESIRGIDAPRPVLTCGVVGKWGGSAAVDGLSFRQHDDINEWSQITPHDQTGPQAYKLAAKVWDRVKRAQTMSQAVDILRQAGCKFHGYCAMD